VKAASSRVRALRALVATAGLAAAVLAPPSLVSCGDESSRGQLTVVIQTDLAMPKDINWMRVEVRSDGVALGTDDPPPLHRNDYPIDPGEPPDLRVTIPATFAVLNGHGTAEPVAVRVTAGRDGVPRVLRDAITTVPSDRNAMLRIYLQWLSDGSAKPPPDPAADPRSAINACPDGQTNIAGECVDAHVDGASLAEFRPEAVFGGPDRESGHAFDVLSCFATTETVTPDDACSFAVPAGAAQDMLNVGLELPAGSDGVCNSAHCVVALDRQEPGAAGPRVGWALTDRVQLPPGVCARTSSVPAARVVLSRECPSKTESMPICGPSSAVPDCSIHGAQDGGTSTPTGDRDITLTLGADHTCTWRDFAAFCWGRNDLGQVGDPSLQTVPVTRPAESGLTLGVAQVSAGRDATCAVSGDGVYCWGNNRFGQVGITPVPHVDTPIPTPTLVPLQGLDVEQVAVSDSTTEQHACALAAPQMWCWGANTFGELGVAGPDGLYPDGFDMDATALALGDGFTCVLREDKKVECWGKNDLGQLGRQAGTPLTQSPLPRGGTASAVPDSQRIVAGETFACALTTDRRIYCWGNGATGAVTGAKTPGDQALAPAEKLLSSGAARELVAGRDFACAIVVHADGPENVVCWGDDQFGQLGGGTVDTTSNEVALPPSIVPPFDHLYAGDWRACVSAHGAVACWGYNDYGQIAESPSTSLPPTLIAVP
jgi:alpha-tubulin suppressor-like RCC1 family protein